MRQLFVIISAFFCGAFALRLQRSTKPHSTRTSAKLQKCAIPSALFSSSIDDREAEVKIIRNPQSGAYDMKEWTKAFLSQPEEFDYLVPEDDIDGELPADLCGQEYGHYLDGDGYLTRVTFKNGKAHFLSKFVRTAEYAAENKAKKVLYRSTFRTQPKAVTMYLFGTKIDLNNLMDLKLKNQANTNILNWGGKLLAYFEAGLPHKIDPTTLETIGTDDMNVGMKGGIPVFIEQLHSAFPLFHQKVFGSFSTAHPKIDKKKDVLVSWISNAALQPGELLASNPYLKIFEWDQNFQPTGPPVKYIFRNSAIAPHDFSFTDNYYVFVENRAAGDTLPYLLGTKSPASCMELNAEQPMVLHLIPRPDGKKIDKGQSAGARDVPLGTITVPLSPGFTIHSCCAFEREDVMELYTTAWKVESVMSGEVKGGLLGNWEGPVPDFDNIPPTLLYHTRVDMKTGHLISHEPANSMENTVIEHPHTNPNCEGAEVRYLYMSLGSNTGHSSPPVGYLRLDLQTGEKQEWYAPMHTYCEEVVVVQKKKNRTERKEKETESDVWVIGSMFDAVKNRACVGIFDGLDLAKGPVATVWMSHPLPHSLHGSFDPNTYIDF